MPSVKKVDHTMSCEKCVHLAQEQLLTTMNNMRKQDTMCDVTLVVKGQHFTAHRMVLAAASEFFSLMFTTPMMESTSREVKLDAEPTTIELLLDFIYTTRISINNINVQSLLEASNLYLIKPLKERCVEFLKGELDAINSPGIFAFADRMACQKLKELAEDFLLLHFTNVYIQDDFLALDVTQIVHVLHQDKLTVQSEAQVYDAAIRWIKHDLCNREQHMADVFGCVRFPLIPKTFLSTKVLTEPLIQANLHHLTTIIDGMRHHLLSSDDVKDLGESSRPRFKKGNYQIALFGSLKSQSCSYFDPKVLSWTYVCCPKKPRQDATAVFWDNVVYILGGLWRGSLLNEMDCYSVLKKCWYSKLGPLKPRVGLAACVAQGKIYTSGGSGGSNLFECYDTKTELWQVQPKMLMKHCGHGSVEVNGLIYVCGGVDDYSGAVLNNCEVFDPNTKRWRALCGMRVARKNHGLVVVNNMIYAVGGQGAKLGLDSVEIYNIASNKWHPASSMPWIGSIVKCAALEKVIYVLASSYCSNNLCHMLEYHTDTDRWVTRPQVRAFPDPNCAICVVDMSGADEDQAISALKLK